MADRYWVGGKSGSETSWDDADNWATTSGGSGGAGVPTTSDDVFIDGGAATDYDCIAAGAANCKSLTASSGFTDDISIGGLLTVDDGNASFDHTGTLTLNDVTVNGNSKTLHIGSGVGTVTAISCDVTWNGTGGTWDNDKGYSIFGKLSLAASAGLTLDGSATIFRSTSTPLTLGDNSTLTINAQCWLNCNGSVDLWSLGTGYTIDGSSSLVITNGGVTGLSITMPAITVGGSVTLNFYDLPANTFTMAGHFTVATAMYISNSAGIATFDCDGYNINVTPGFQGLAIGSGGAGPTNKMLIYFGSGTHTLTRLEVQYNGTGTYTYLESATFNIGGNVTFGSNHNIDTGTSVINLTGTSNCTFTTAGKSVYDLSINKTGGTGVTFTGNIDSHDFEVETTNTQAVTWAGYTLTVSGNVSLNGTGTLDLGNGVTCNGASSNFHIDSTVGTVTATSCVLTMNGTTGMTLDIDKSITISKLVTANNSVINNTNLQFITISNSDQLLVVGDNSVITDLRVNLRVSASTNTPYVLGSGYAFNNSGAGTVIQIIATTAGITVGFPAITLTPWYSVYPQFNLYDWATNSTANILGNITTSVMSIDFYNTGITFNTNNYTINCNTQGLFNLNGFGSGSVFNLGSSTINCGAFRIQFNGTTNMDSATININGTAASYQSSLSSTATINAGTSVINLQGTVAITFTTNGHTLYDININRVSTSGISLTSNLICHDFTVQATNTQATTWSGYTLTASGNVSLNGTGTLDLGNGVTCNGASSNFHIESTVGTVTASSCVVTMNTATAGVIDIDKSTSIKQLIINGIVTATANFAIVPPNGTSPITLTDGSTFTNNTTEIDPTVTSAALFTLGTGVTLNGTGRYFCQWSGDCTIPGLSSTNTLEGHGINSGSLTLAGNVSITQRFTHTTFVAFSRVLNLNGFNLTCSEFKIGSSVDGGAVTINYSSGILSTTYFNGAQWNKADTHNLETATINCSGSMRFGSNATVNPGTSTLNVLNTSSITLAGKSLHTVNLNAPTKTITSVDNLTTTGALTITDGTTYATGATTTTVGTNLTDLNGTTFNKLVMASTSAKQITIGAGKTMTLSTAANSDISGSSGAACTIRSNSSGTQATIAFPSQLTLSYVDVKDIISSGFQTLANNGTNVTGGNNTNWKFMNLDSVSPNIIKLAGGDIITVTDNGTGIRGTCTVSVEGDAGTSVTVVDSQHLTFAAPAKGVIGTYDVTVSTDDGESFTLTNELEYDEAPIITSVSPVKGPTAGGITVDVNGSGFEAVQGTGIVKFDGVEVTAYNSWADNKVNVTIPAHATGFVDVYLKDTPGGEDTLTNGFQYKDSGGAGTFFFFE